jgi:hypothetical protein
MEPKTYSLLFLAGLFALTTFITGIIASVALSLLATGILIGLIIFSIGGYYVYSYFTKDDSREIRIFNGVVGAFLVVSGMITCFIPIYSFDEYNAFVRFSITIFLAGSIHLVICIFWYIPIQRWGNGTIPTLGYSDLKQTIFFIITGLADVAILSIAYCFNFSSSSVFGKLILRSFISSIIAVVPGALTSVYLHHKSSETGYEPADNTADQLRIDEQADNEASFE